MRWGCSGGDDSAAAPSVTTRWNVSVPEGSAGSFMGRSSGVFVCQQEACPDHSKLCGQVKTARRGSATEKAATRSAQEGCVVAQCTDVSTPLLLSFGHWQVLGVSSDNGSGRMPLGRSGLGALEVIDVRPCEKSEGDGTRTRNHRIDSPVL